MGIGLYLYLILDFSILAAFAIKISKLVSFLFCRARGTVPLTPVYYPTFSNIRLYLRPALSFAILYNQVQPVLTRVLSLDFGCKNKENSCIAQIFRVKNLGFTEIFSI